MLKLKIILCLLTNSEFGLQEIKREIREIEEELDNNDSGNEGGPISTGPFLVRTGVNNAINVKVQNVGDEPIDAVIRLFDVGQCPPEEIDSVTLTDIGGGCCVQDGVVTAPAGDMEVVICPDPIDASIRAFVSVHSGATVTGAIEYVFRAAEMLSPACEFCVT